VTNATNIRIRIAHNVGQMAIATNAMRGIYTMPYPKTAMLLIQGLFQALEETARYVVEETT